MTSETELIASMGALRAQLLVARKRELLWRLFVLVVIFVGAWLIVGQRHTTDDILATRTESRVATCRSDNTFITNHNALVDSVERAAQLVSVPNATRTPDQQAGIDKFVAEYTATVEHSRVPLRDCSPAALDAFYKGK